MSMTKKDFEVVTKALNTSLMEANGESQSVGVMNTIDIVADMFEQNYPNFNRQMFIQQSYHMVQKTFL